MRAAHGPLIYALVDPRDDAIRYVGKCQAYLSTRVGRHLWEASQPTGRTHRIQWIRHLLAKGLAPRAVVLEQVASNELLAEAERRWIAQLRAEGVRLTNMTDGGEGMPNPTEETRAKLRARPQGGFNPKAAAASSRRMTELWADPEWGGLRRAEMAARRTKPERMSGDELVQFKIENAKRMGAGNRGRTKSEEHRRKLSEAVRRVHAEGRGRWGSRENGATQ